jgi:hypothetical protein
MLAAANPILNTLLMQPNLHFFSILFEKQTYITSS